MIESLRNAFDPLFDLMAATLSTFHAWGAPWWLAIVMLTVVVRALLFPPTVRQVKSMRKVQEFKPDMDEIRAKYKDDQRKQQEEIMKLYGERKVNPLGGCLPVFVQLPIYLVLYYTIKDFEHLDSFRTGGLLWFQDLTVADSFFLLPLAYVVTMMASQELTIRYTVPQQQKLMRLLPVVFALFLMCFPAGLFVYWISSNLITFVQNYAIYRRPLAKKGTGRAAPPEDRAPSHEAPASAAPGPEEPSGRCLNRSPAQDAGATANGAAIAKQKRRKKAKKRK
jgi:YidC/Oxa1 family membrane protein insertase